LVTIWPCDQPQPTASNLNLTAAATSPNLVITKISERLWSSHSEFLDRFHVDSVPSPAE
jgi:hypothetical protein